VTRGVTMRFGGLTAVKSLNMTVPRQSLYGLIGPNGAGKTTVFNVLTGVYCPTEGDIQFDGVRIERKTPFEITRLGAARTFQNIRLFADMTVLDNVMTAHHLRSLQGLADAVLGSEKHHKEEQHTRERAMELLAIFNLTRSRRNRRRACRTAVNGGSRLRVRWQPNRNCCSSTSPRPA
jgi:branched-chain amino acid transport system ATP-binding protein